MKTIMFAIIAFPVLSLAGHDQGNGDLRQPFTPAEAFSYSCEATLEQLQPLQPGQEIRDISSLVSKQSFQIDSSGPAVHGMLTLQEDSWKVFRKTEYPAVKFEEIPRTQLTYPLKNHFVSMSFEQRDDETFVDLRAVIYGLADGWASTNFSSSFIRERVQGNLPQQKYPVTLAVECRKSE